MTDPNPDDGQKVAASKGVLLQANEITIRTRSGINLFSDISFHIEPGELIALTGVSRSGKSTLLQSLAGLMKPASGEILIDGVSLYANLKAFRSTIGFVPAEYALQQNLTVAEVLQEGATLRLPRRASHQDREQRVRTLLEAVGLTEVSDSRVGSLSRAEKRKIGIAVELISSPALLLLDESAEPLTPFEETQITILLRTLARQGITIIQADQRARSAGLSDKVIFLAPGGLLAWFGPSEEAFSYLRTLVPRGLAKDLFGLKEALELLTTPQLEDGIEWARRFKSDLAYQKYVDDPLHNRYPDLMLQTHPVLRLRLRNNSQDKLPPVNTPRASIIQKFILLIQRNFRLLWRDRTIFFMIAVPASVALFDFLLFSTTSLDPAHSLIVIGMLVFLGLLTATVLVQNEISKERAVYQRESRASSLLFSYTLSKVWLAGVLALYQGIVWAIIPFAATGMAEALQILPLYAITFALVALIGGLSGLIISALSRRGMTNTNWVLLFTVPQLILCGAIVPVANLNFLFKFLSGVNPSRYAFEALVATSKLGEGFNLSLFSYWLILTVMSLCLIVLLVVIQWRAGRVRT